MSTKSDNPDRPYRHLTDLELAQKLAQMESVLEQDTGNESQESICWIRNHLIEEILFRYKKAKFGLEDREDACSHYSDTLLAETLAKMEAAMISGIEQMNVSLFQTSFEMRNTLIEEIIFRYQKSER